MALHSVFITGGMGYVGQPLLRQLSARGHAVCALARRGSEHKVPSSAIAVIGDALDASTFTHAVAPADTLIHLVGTPHPSPAKARELRSVDRVSIEAAVHAATQSGVSHFVYVSVAHPAPVMHAYIDVRVEGETLVRAGGLSATIVRPWYILGPGHRWPHLLRPLYALAERLPASREAATRLGLVTLDQMVSCLVRAIEHPPQGVAIVEVAAIRAAGSDPDLRRLGA